LILGALILVPLLALVSHNWRVPLGLALVLGLGILYTLHINAANRRLLATQEELRRAQASQRRAFEDLEAANRGLEAERAKLRGITETAVDGIFLLDSEGRIVYANPAAERILGYGAGELLGRDAHLSLATSRAARARPSCLPALCPKRDESRPGHDAHAPGGAAGRRAGAGGVVDRR
jgi:PAS domain-containing protein